MSGPTSSGPSTAAPGASGRVRRDHTAGTRTAGITFLVGLFIFTLSLCMAYWLVDIWPTSEAVGKIVVWNGFTESIALQITMICGAIGAFVHVATSFASFAGNRSLRASWAWWFVLRPVVGAAMALIFYFILRSGLLLDGPLGEAISPFGVAAASALVGLFSKHLVDKIRTVSEAAFNTNQDSERHDKL